VESDVYKNRNLKDAGYDELVEKIREIEDDADRDILRKKINGFRIAYRRELKKTTDSTKSGIGTDDIYVPSLWYFDNLDSLRHHGIQVAGKSTTEDDICQETEVCANLLCRVWTQSLVVKHTVAQICLTMYGALYSESYFLYCISYSFSMLVGGEGIRHHGMARSRAAD